MWSRGTAIRLLPSLQICYVKNHVNSAPQTPTRSPSSALSNLPVFAAATNPITVATDMPCNPTSLVPICIRTRTDKAYADTPMNPIRSRADMPANQPCDKTPCRPAYGTDPVLHRTATYRRQTDSAAMPAITILIAPIRLRSTDRMIVPIYMRSRLPSC